MDRAAYDPATTEPGEPVLSLVVVVHDMPRQAERTLHTLSPGYQRGAPAGSYEVIVVENASGRLLGEPAARATGPHVRYFLNADETRSPVSAVNLGVSRARGSMVGILVDGARLLSPGVARLALLAARGADVPALVVPGYHLGSELQQKAVDGGYDEAREAALLDGIAWPDDGYRLFEVSCLSGSCAGGLFAPFAESNCLCVPRSLFDALGGFDPRFALPGGGFSNLDFYARVLERAEVTPFVTPGEGTFHQFHGGVTTGGLRAEARTRFMQELREEYRAIRGRDFELTRREPFYLGAIPEPARRFVQSSTERWSDATTEAGAS